MAEKMFINALKKAFEEDPSDKTTTFYKFGGWRQSERKREFVEAGKEVAAKRGIPRLAATSLPASTNSLFLSDCLHPPNL